MNDPVQVYLAATPSPFESDANVHYYKVHRLTDHAILQAVRPENGPPGESAFDLPDGYVSDGDYLIPADNLDAAQYAVQFLGYALVKVAVLMDPAL